MDIFTGILLGIFGTFVVLITISGLSSVSKIVGSGKKRQKRHKDHARPDGLMHRGGFIDIYICQECDLTGDFWSVGPYDPCWRCGSKKKRKEVVGKWNGVKWVSRGEDND